MNQISRYGVYGLLLSDSKILLTQKKSGPYQGQWGLPGGAIEFGETPEEALKRELLEESSLIIDQMEFLNTATSMGQYDNQGVPYEFHQVGLIYKVLTWSERSDLVSEEENRWVPIQHVKIEELTPFAKHAISNLPRDRGWRPQNRIRGKVIGFAKHKDRLLVCEVLNDDGVLKGWCPLGGGIEFGEKAEAALRREFQEELECSIQITGNPMVWENIFEHHGMKGHEIIFAFPVHFDNPEIYAKNRFQISEARGTTHWVEWIEAWRFGTGECILFPPGLAEKIDSI
ncbi:MAG: NUDIX domain-containing protein [Chlamydiae bacterium]|nr:NUDIX domain-containing protein [Chlamydiota bacterium]